MKAPRLRAWNKELKMMELPEEIFTRDNIHMLLNETDYIWMRSTERVDKEGKEIFAGDLIKSSSTFLLEVFWNIEQMAFYLKWKDEQKFSNAEPMRCMQYEWPDVKNWGNIYENPELMEKQECECKTVKKNGMITDIIICGEHNELSRMR